MVSKAIMTSGSTEWETPGDLFDLLNEEFHFTLDPCATPANTKCECYFDKSQDGLSKNWSKYSNSVFCNPPYGNRVVDKWMKKAYEEAVFNNITVVCLIPSRTDTGWWHGFVSMAHEIRFLKGRVSFDNSERSSENSSTFPSAVIIFKRGRGETPIIRFWNWRKDIEKLKNMK